MGNGLSGLCRCCRETSLRLNIRSAIRNVAELVGADRQSRPLLGEFVTVTRIALRRGLSGLVASTAVGGAVAVTLLATPKRAVGDCGKRPLRGQRGRPDGG